MRGKEAGEDYKSLGVLAKLSALRDGSDRLLLLLM